MPVKFANLTAATLTAIQRYFGLLSLKTVGAVGDGVTDDGPAVQAWLNDLATLGVPGLAPWGTYLCNSAALTWPSQPVIIYGLGAIDPYDFGDAGTVFKEGPNYQGTGLFSQIVTGAQQKGMELYNLTLDGGGGAANVDLLQVGGNVDSPILQDVILSRGTGNGYRTLTAGGFNPTTGRYLRLRARQCALSGINTPAHTDAVWADCAARGCGSGGVGPVQDSWIIGFCPNSSYYNPRAEFGAKNGFNLTNGGGFTLVNPSTDRNAQSGIAVTGAGPFTSTQPIKILAPMCRRDASGGSGSGIAVIGAAVPVIITSPEIYTGTDDGGGGLNSPGNGITIQNSKYVAVRGPGYIQAATTPFNILGGNGYLDIDEASIITATGTNTGSPGQPGAPTFAQVFTTLTNANLANGWTIGGSLRLRSVGRYLEMILEDVISPGVAQADGSAVINAGVLPGWLAPATTVRLPLSVGEWQFETTGAVTCYGFSALTTARVDGVARVPLD